MPIARTRRLVRQFLAQQAASGFDLAAAAALAVASASSPLAAGYAAQFSRCAAGLSELHWVNDRLLTMFDPLLGIEIKRIGFATTLLTAGLAFGDGNATNGPAQQGIIVGSLLAAAGAYLVLAGVATR